MFSTEVKTEKKICRWFKTMIGTILRGWEEKQRDHSFSNLVASLSKKNYSYL